MSRPLVYRRPARREFDEAADWYEQQKAGLGVKFTAAVQDVLDEAAANPRRYPEVFGDVREGIVNGFPYCVYYREAGGSLLIVAIFHTARDPSTWQSRV